MIEQFLALFARLVIAVEALANIKDEAYTYHPTEAPTQADVAYTAMAKAVVAAPVVAAPVVAAPVVAAPVVAAPVVAAPVVAAPVAGANPFNNPNIVMDSFHHYWDAEIHTEVRSKNADGSWKLKRGIDRTAATAKLKEQDFLFLQATGRSATEAATSVPGLHSTAQVEDEDADVDDSAFVVPPPIAQAPRAPKTVRVPEHGDPTKFTKEEVIDLLGDCFVAYGEPFNAEYSVWLKESGRPGMSYASIDDGAVTWFAFKALEFLRNV